MIYILGFLAVVAGLGVINAVGMGIYYAIILKIAGPAAKAILEGKKRA